MTELAAASIQLWPRTRRLMYIIISGPVNMLHDHGQLPSRTDTKDQRPSVCIELAVDSHDRYW